jgi:hypothetical protein
LVQKLYSHGCVDVGLGGGEEDEILVGNGDVRDAIEEKDRIVPILLGCDDLRTVVLYFCPGDIVFKGTVYQYLAFDIDEHH